MSVAKGFSMDGPLMVTLPGASEFEPPPHLHSASCLPKRGLSWLPLYWQYRQYRDGGAKEQIIFSRWLYYRMFSKTWSAHHRDKLLVPVTCIAYERRGKAMVLYMARTKTEFIGPLLRMQRTGRQEGNK